MNVFSLDFLIRKFCAKMACCVMLLFRRINCYSPEKVEYCRFVGRLCKPMYCLKYVMRPIQR